MPIISFKKGVKRTQRHNQKVYNELANLQHILYETQQEEHLFTALTELRNAPLKFKNQWIVYVIAINALLFFLFLVLPKYNGFIFLLIMVLSFIAYLHYETQKPIQQCIIAFEKRIIRQHYDLNYLTFPPSFMQHHHRSGLMAFSFLKQRFYPLFEQGEISNVFPEYASSVWTDAQGKHYPVLIFQYDAVHKTAGNHKYLPNGFDILLELLDRLTTSKTINQDGQKIEHLWGVFVFDVEMNGFAVATKNQYFPAHYTKQWRTADIQINQRLFIRGERDLHLAQMMTAQRLLMLNQLFAKRDGYLHCHADMSMMCFLTNKPLLQLPKTDYQQIDDIARLRGHLRRLKLVEYEQLQKDMLAFLQNEHHD